ncbi:MAG TPA: 6-carboxytetrahydropterin synthase QueD [Phycisphaerae bacterium]|nr:6-carboxytetrahydropterin synthase QueD [Phycisphaerae bacterium]
MELFKRFSFEAAHRLPNVPADHKCARLHGHSYRVAVHVRGPLDPHLGWVMDFADLKKAFESLHSRLNHSCLNDIEGLANPTSEVLARWIWQRLRLEVPGLCKVVVLESEDNGCIYEGDES